MGTKYLKSLNYTHFWLLIIATALLGLTRVRVSPPVLETHEIPATEGARTTPAQRLLLGHKVDLNRAGDNELLALPGIGPSMARRILLDRSKKGAFRSVDDLSRIRGIGPATLARLRPLVIVTADPNR